jgi:hypothetical protein
MKKSFWVSMVIMGTMMLLGVGAKAQFVVTVDSGELENVATVGDVTTVDSAHIDNTQWNPFMKALGDLQTTLTGGYASGMAGVGQIAKTIVGTQPELNVVRVNNPKYPDSYQTEVSPIPNWDYDGADLLSLTPGGVSTAKLFRPISIEKGTTQWPENYIQYTAMEQKTDNTVKIFSQTSQNIDNLRQQEMQMMQDLRSATGSVEVQMIQARLEQLHMELDRQIYLRTAALQDVQLLDIATRNNVAKRDEANSEEQSVDHENQTTGPITALPSQGALLGQLGGFATMLGIMVTSANNAQVK